MNTEAQTVYKHPNPVADYEPVLYEVVKDPVAASKDREGLTSIQEGFLARTERLLQIFHQRSHIHDGLKNLSDKEVIRKVREAPTKLKKSAQTPLKKLKKHGVYLDDKGDVVYSAIEDEHVRSEL